CPPCVAPYGAWSSVGAPAAPPVTEAASAIAIAQARCPPARSVMTFPSLCYVIHWVGDELRVGDCRQTRLARLARDEEPDHQQVGEIEKRAGGKGRRVEAEMVIYRAGEPAAEGHAGHPSEH